MESEVGSEKKPEFPPCLHNGAYQRLTIQIQWVRGMALCLSRQHVHPKGSCSGLYEKDLGELLLTKIHNTHLDLIWYKAASRVDCYHLLSALL